MRRFLFMTLALAACGSQGGDESARSNGTVTLELPPATPFNPSENVSALENQTNTASDVADNASVAEDEQPAPKAAETETSAAEEKPAAPKPADAPPKQAGSAETSSEEARLLPARLPLADAEIARTIERIGFACGEVIASNRVESGDQEAYKVSCSSGKSYQGTMKNGRMFFREWTGRLTRE
ncbi:hypothetical protein [Sphingosinicella rhizophila]|uniref:Secreted protein n=1 Tax=Sphingosinicella rhizophila TaxID=3050082 RepID=A0ABU3Q6D3_9SPHN|nr:hypothetical protein [Sphingosinicella sp. GR2756]MDT9598959.1 hypothetical protein [Sphingosinicella sp. GR2756]